MRDEHPARHNACAPAWRGRRQAEDLRRDLTVDWVGIRLDDGASSTVTLSDPFCAADEHIDALLESMEHSATELPAGV